MQSSSSRKSAGLAPSLFTGLEIVGFPCNQFGSQEPGSDAEIQEFCQVRHLPVCVCVCVCGGACAVVRVRVRVRAHTLNVQQKNYGVSFPIMKKIHVNGDDTHPVYAFLKSSKSGLLGLTRIKWNFEVRLRPFTSFFTAQNSEQVNLTLAPPHDTTRTTRTTQKFLVDKEGVVEERYSSLTKPESLESTVEKLLHK
jgi:glutathione peroxidase-family protein